MYIIGAIEYILYVKISDNPNCPALSEAINDKSETRNCQVIVEYSSRTIYIYLIMIDQFLASYF